jgi:glycosyltransferase involved in cell wall biosynthesis
MKIGFISTYFYPAEGGAERVCLSNARELAKKHEVHVYTSDRKCGKLLGPNEEKIFSINVHRCRELIRLGYYFASYPSMLWKVLKQDLDIVHVESIGFLQHDVIILLKKIFSPKTKFVNTPHGPYISRNNSIPARMVKALIGFFENPVNSIYSATTIMSPAQEDWLPNVNLRNPIVIPAGLPKDFFRIVNAKDFVVKYGLESKTIITYIGRIQEYKGIQHVLQCFGKILEKHPDTVFVIGGIDDGYLQELKRIAKEKNLEKNVAFMGEIDEETKIKALEVSDIYVFPSEWEAFGISMLEAMARGNAIISTKTEGGRFLIKEGENGFLYDFGNVVQLENELTNLLDNIKIRQSMQEKNRMLAKKFLWPSLVKQIENVYVKVLNENRKN